jgi:hypothetical protein
LREGAIRGRREETMKSDEREAHEKCFIGVSNIKF